MPFPTNHCEKCGDLTTQPEDEYGEFICIDCQQNAAEAAWERQFEGEPPASFEETYRAAWQQKQSLR